MKKIILFIMIMIIIICSCSYDQLNFFQFDSPWFDNTYEACQWVYKNIDYKLTPKRIKNPQETLDDGKGDCADMTLLLMAIMNYQYNIKSEYVVVNTKKKGIKHAYMKYNGYYYDCTNGEKSRSYPEEHFQTLNYYQAMAVCYLN